MRRKAIVVGGGTAGLISAITLLRTCADVTVTVIRSSKIGHIMVGEGTFAATPIHLHDVLGIPRQDFYDRVNPTLKLGLRLLWGPRPSFDFPFNEQYNSEALPSPGKPWGFYSLSNWEGISPFPADADIRLPPGAGYHLVNQAFVEFLEGYFVGLGGELIDAKVVSASAGEGGVESVRCESGEEFTGDFFVDASGFSGVLIHQALGVPYVSMRRHLFCDRAVVGGWARGDDEPIKLYTTAETMDAGWCWRIEHEHIINRGYVFCSSFLSDERAADEFLRKNPKVPEAVLRVVPFETRHVQLAWVKNVVAIGNASGFVEPLEATNIQVICLHALGVAKALEADDRPDGGRIEDFNRVVTLQWQRIRDFLALHYRFNTRLKTPFWEMAVRETPLGELEDYVQKYQELGPNLLSDRFDMFGRDGCLAMLLGMRVPWNSCTIS